MLMNIAREVAEALSNRTKWPIGRPYFLGSFSAQIALQVIG
jgi:hypothetical protein